MNPPHDDAGVASATTGGNTGLSPNLRPWVRGQSGNPSGRSLALVNLAWEARRATDGGRELVKLQLAIARGEEIPYQVVREASAPPSINDSKLLLGSRIAHLENRKNSSRSLASPRPRSASSSFRDSVTTSGSSCAASWPGR
jgi:hypothetical protein